MTSEGLHIERELAFQRYVWVNGERRRKRNRETYERRKAEYENSAIADVTDEEVPVGVEWPGEISSHLENEEKRRRRKRQKREDEERSKNVQEEADDSPLQQTPSELSEKSESENEMVTPEKVPEKVQTPHAHENFPITPGLPFVLHRTDGTFPDEDLPAPRELSNKQNSFFLVGSSLVAETAAQVKNN